MIVELSVFGVLLSLGIWQGIILFSQSRDRDKRYEAACAHAAATGKPLLVAGGPLGNTWFRRFFTSPAHGCGNICMDIDHRAIAGYPYGVVADARQMPFPDKSFGAVFASHLLEHLPTIADAQAVLSEFERVAHATLIAHPYRQSVMTWIIPSHHLCVWQENETIYVRQRNRVRNRHEKEILSYPNKVTFACGAAKSKLRCTDQS